MAAVAGLMVGIAPDQLLPAAEKYGDLHHGIFGLVTGMAIMALSLRLFLSVEKRRRPGGQPSRPSRPSAG